MLKSLLLLLIKPLSFIPALLMMYAIFTFSSQTGDQSGNLSYEVSYQIVSTADHIMERGLTEADKEYYASSIEYYVRKLAHMTEYFILAVCVSLPFYVYGLRGFPLLLVAGFICVGFACGDEYHQSFVDGRGPSVRDVCIDSVGVFTGIIVVRIICYTLLAPARMWARHQRRAARRRHRRR